MALLHFEQDGSATGVHITDKAADGAVTVALEHAGSRESKLISNVSVRYRTIGVVVPGRGKGARSR